MCVAPFPFGVRVAELYEAPNEKNRGNNLFTSPVMFTNRWFVNLAYNLFEFVMITNMWFENLGIISTS